MKEQVHLRVPGESLQIPYPSNYKGPKSGHPSDTEFFLGLTPRFLTTEEVAVAEAYIGALPYRQSLSKTGAKLIDANDPLLTCSHEDLDEAEAAAHLPNSRNMPGGGERATRERVLLIRERGYQGNGKLAIQAGGNE